ncbi:MAG: glycosyltransferase family 2 protein [Gemmataceae bacterium]
MRPNLSIVVPSHNRPDLLRACLRSVRRHMPPGTRLLVVDDGSEEAVVSRVAEEFGAGALRLSRRKGYCVAANAGVALAQTEVVELLNDDTEVTAGWADAALDRFAAPRVVAVTPLVLRTDSPDLVDSAGDTYHPFGVARKRGHGRRLSFPLLAAGPVFGASGSSSFFRREAFLRAGGLPEEFGAYFDDIDLSFRLRRAGGEVWFEPASRVYHHVSSSHGSPAGDLLAMQSRNEELVWWRNLEGWQLLLTLPGHLAVLAGKALFRLREGQFRPWLRGRLAAWASLPEVIEHRRRLAALHLPAAPPTPSIPGSVALGAETNADAGPRWRYHGVEVGLGDHVSRRRDAARAGR